MDDSFSSYRNADILYSLADDKHKEKLIECIGTIEYDRDFDNSILDCRIKLIPEITGHKLNAEIAECLAKAFSKSHVQHDEILDAFARTGTSLDIIKSLNKKEFMQGDRQSYEEFKIKNQKRLSREQIREVLKKTPDFFFHIK